MDLLPALDFPLLDVAEQLLHLLAGDNLSAQIFPFGVEGEGLDLDDAGLCQLLLPISMAVLHQGLHGKVLHNLAVLLVALCALVDAAAVFFLHLGILQHQVRVGILVEEVLCVLKGF